MTAELGGKPSNSTTLIKVSMRSSIPMGVTADKTTATKATAKTAVDKPATDEPAVTDEAKAKADADKAAVETAKGNPMLGDDRTVNADGARDFATDVRKLVDEISERLDAEVGKHLTDMAVTVDDPRSGRLLAGGNRLKATVDSVQEQLRYVAQAAAQLGQDVTA